MSAIDIIFLALIGLLMIRCYLKGLISELLSMAAVVLGVLASIFFYKNGAMYLRENFWPELTNPIPEIVSFVALFVIVFFIVKLLEVLLKEVVKGLKLGGANKFLGLIFGFAEGVAVVSLILFLFQLIKPIYDASNLLSESFIAELLLPLITEPANILIPGDSNV